MTNDSDAQHTRDAAVDAATEDEKATAAPPAVVPRDESHDLAGLDVFADGEAPTADVIAAEDNEEALDATRPRAAAVLLDADAAAHLAADPAPNLSAPARQLPIVRAQPLEPAETPRDDGAAADEGGEEYTYYDEDEDDGDETVIAQATPRPRTLSAAFRPPRDDDTPPRETPPLRDERLPHETPPPREERLPRQESLPREERLPRDATLPPFPAVMPLAEEPEDDGDAIEDELDPEEEWAVADQPTIYMPPKRGSGTSRAAPQQEGWPYRPQPGPGQGRGPTGPRPGIVRPGVPLRRFASIPAPRSGYEGPRLASPTGRPMPGTPPDGVSPAALADPRMERFQHLRESREAHEHGDRAPDEMRPVSEIVRRWWGDLLPGLRGALHHQHEAQASGVHPASPYDAAPASRLGDAFGRLTQSARDLTERARPALQRIHDQAEHAAQALVGRFEQPTAVQQAPFLGPGRVAIFFKSGVTVGQAHALLVRRQARPMRLIPRKHGFLAAVAPGREAEVCDGLRDHPYVRDVAYIAYDDAGQPIDQEA